MKVDLNEHHVGFIKAAVKDQLNRITEADLKHVVVQNYRNMLLDLLTRLNA